MPFNASSSFLPFVQISRIVTQVGFYSSSIICFIFIVLTLFGINNKFGNYIYLLLTFSTTGILFASMEFLFNPNAHSYNAGFLLFTTSRPFGLKKDALEVCLAVYTGVYASTITMLSVQFIYRYWAVFHRHKLRKFKGYWLVFWLAYSIAFGIEWALGVYFLDRADDFSRDYFKNVMEEKYNMNIDEIAGFPAVAYGSDGSLRYKNLTGFINRTSIMLVQYAIIVYCAVMMYLNMEAKLIILSAPMRRLHRQFYKTLVLQVTLPSILLFTPVILIIYIPLLDVELNVPSGSSLCSLSLYPAMDALILMCVVSDYWVAVKRLFNEMFFDSHAEQYVMKSVAVSSTADGPVVAESRTDSEQN